jgi:hypothetical protein
VFTTCGSDRKKAYLLKTFPGLREDHIGNSRSTSFEHMIMHQVRASPAPFLLSGDTSRYAAVPSHFKCYLDFHHKHNTASSVEPVSVLSTYIGMRAMVEDKQGLF